MTLFLLLLIPLCTGLLCLATSSRARGRSAHALSCRDQAADVFLRDRRAAAFRDSVFLESARCSRHLAADGRVVAPGGAGGDWHAAIQHFSKRVQHPERGTRRRPLDWTALLFISSVVTIFTGFLRHMLKMNLITPHGVTPQGDCCPWKLGAMISLAVVIVAVGLWPPAPLFQLVQQTAQIIQGCP